MSLKKNIIANYIGQAYKALIGIIVMPLYLKYLGAEAYGLIGFFVMLQAALQLLDMGLRPTLAREAARYKAKTLSKGDLRALLRSLEGIFGAIAIFLIFLIYMTSMWIANDWLNLEYLKVNDVANAIGVMGLVAALRWFTTLYRGIVSGFERQVWINGYDIIFGTFRFLGVLIVFEFVDASIEIFFVYQLIISLFEAGIVTLYTYHLLPHSDENDIFSWRPLKNVYRFAFSIAFTGIIWIIVTQVDKLLLSHLLPLAEYGYFSLAIIISNGIYVLGNAIGNALMPRLTVYNEQGNTNKLEQTYFMASQIVAIIVIPIASLLVVFGKEIVFLWTQDIKAPLYVVPILFWYTLGSLALSFSTFGYYLQYAKGDLRLHVRGIIIYALITLPLMYYVSYYFGAIGTGMVWFGVNLLYLFLWIGIIHNRFLEVSHISWLRQIGNSVLGSFLIAYLVHSFIELSEFSHMLQIIFLINIGLILFLINIYLAKDIRNYIINKVKI